MQFGQKKEVELDNENSRRNLEENLDETLVKSLNISLYISNVECKEGDPNYGIEKTDSTHKIKNTNQKEQWEELFWKAKI